MNQAECFNKIVADRRSVRIFDTKHDYDKRVVAESLQNAILSPNSSNMQLWEFYRILDEDIKTQMAKYCLNQLPASTASELVVFVARPDKYKQSIQFNLDLINDPTNFETEKRKEKRRNYYKKMMPAFYSRDFLFLFSFVKKLYVTIKGIKKPVVREVGAVNKRITIHKSIGLSAQTFMLSVKSRGYDTCPMEGFDSKRIKQLLDLPKQTEINMVVAVGKAAKDGIWYPRKRYEYEEIVKIQ